MSTLPSVEAIVLPMPALLGTVNAHLIRGPEGAALVDCGLNDASSLRDLEEALKERGLGLSDIDTVFLTHHHVDHAGAARFLQQHGATVVMSSEDAALLEDFHNRPELDAPRVMFSGRHGLPDTFSQSVQSVFSFLRRQGKIARPDRTVADGETLSLGGVRFEAVATPGHTPGHLCLVQREMKLAFTGDCVISPRATHVSADPDRPEADPFQAFLDSLRRLAALKGITPLSGHGAHLKPLHISAPKTIAHLEKELAALSERLSDTPKSAFELSPSVQKMRPRVFPQWLSISQTVTYLHHLTVQGRATCVDTEEGLRYKKS